MDAMNSWCAPAHIGFGHRLHQFSEALIWDLATTAAEPKVRFSAPGTYVLQAIANDGQLSSTYNVTVTVNPASR